MRTFIVFILSGFAAGIMIKRSCPPDEGYRSCSFYQEYVCWISRSRIHRAISSRKRLPHCKSGCFCKKSYVRDYPGGTCIVAAGCHDVPLKEMLAKIPLHR